MNGNECVLVLGMHRSGTSALCRVLLGLGYGEPADPIPPDDENPYGYFESESVIVANDLILKLWNLDFYNPGVCALDEGRVTRNPFCRLWVRNALNAALRGVAGDVVIKDPRISLFPEIWRLGLERRGFNVRPVLSLRHPDHVARSLNTRNGLDPAVSYAIWIAYNARALLSRDLGLTGVVPYSHLVSGDFGKVDWARFVGSRFDEESVVRVAAETIDVGMNRSETSRAEPVRAGAAEAFRSWAIEFYEVLFGFGSEGGIAFDAVRETAAGMLERVAEHYRTVGYEPKKSYLFHASRKRFGKWRWLFSVTKRC